MRSFHECGSQLQRSLSHSRVICRVNSAKDVVKRGQEVWVKVMAMSMAGQQRISLSMRDVDQATGQDLLPGARMAADGVNPSGPAGGPAANQGLRGLSGIKVGCSLRGSFLHLNAARARTPVCSGCYLGSMGELALMSSWEFEKS